MFFELTELLTCPRCGPDHGLILLVDAIEDRRVNSGRLGCANCRTDYPVCDGVADLRLAERAADEQPLGQIEDEGLAVKIAALSGLNEGPGYLLVSDRLAHTAPALADILPDIEVIAITRSAGPAEGDGVSPIAVDSGFPLLAYRLRAAAIAPGEDSAMVREAAMLVRAGGRLILFDAGDAAIAAAEDAGLALIARQDRTAVAERGS